MAKGEIIDGVQFEREQDAYIDRETSHRIDALGDLKYQHQINSTPQQPGTVPYSGEVISIYDSRPINSKDFVQTAYPQWNITAGPPASLTLSTTFTIPGGYVGVVKGYRFKMDPVVPIGYGDLYVDIFADDVAQLGYQSLLQGQTVNDFVPCFILVSDGGNLKIQWRAPTGIASVPGDLRYILVEIYGNLILSTGAPLTLEVANKEVGIPVKATMGSPPQSAGNVVGVAGLSGLGQGNEMTENGRIKRPGSAYRSLTRSRYRGVQRIRRF